MSIISDYLPELEKAVDHFKDDIATLKTGRANPALLDGIVVEAYGAKTPLNQLGSISAPEARSLLIQPWDRSILKDIEKAIIASDLGLAPVNEGERIRLTLPLMTEEVRKEIVKKLHQKLEDGRIAIRNVRDEIKDAITEAADNKEFGEDEKFSLMEDLDKKISEYNDKLKKISEDKEKEIMTI